MAPFISSILSSTLRAHQIYGANTDVGKTIFSTLLCLATKKRYPEQLVHYLKPISTGAEHDSDVRHLLKFAKSSITTARVLQQYKEPVSPHLAAINPPSDSDLLQKIQHHIQVRCNNKAGSLILETAGGVHSPSTSGTSQADLYRPLRLPIILIADSRLGGISTTISAFESLGVRGYDVDGVLIFRDDYYQNHDYLVNYFSSQGQYGHTISTTVTDLPPSRQPNPSKDHSMLAEYYSKFSESASMIEFVEKMEFKHKNRIDKLGNIAQEAFKKIWYPFTQHSLLKQEDITVIDSAYDDFFQTVPSEAFQAKMIPKRSLLNPMFDASASWWTQGLGHGDLSLSMAAAYAAGRYGHVMFAGAIHEPALELAKILLENIPTDRLRRVFYSDNGSTGVEVAIKMAMKATRERYGYEIGQSLEVFGLKGSYHGDTIGAMDCSEPGTFNSQVDWYKGRGHWLDFPKIGMQKGRWIVSLPLEFGQHQPIDLGENISEIFDLSTRSTSPLSTIYRESITSTIIRLTADQKRRFGALIIEPIVLGAGGMLFCDPLYQQLLVSIVRESHNLFSGNSIQPLTKEGSWSGLPVIFDEVFTGLYRLGHFSSSVLLQKFPDISVHAKLLTGGLMPLCVTLASENVFEAFLSEDKKDALLHGHSYTAHAVGCKVAHESLKTLLKLDNENAWAAAKSDWNVTLSNRDSIEKSTLLVKRAVCVWSIWERNFVHKISHMSNVESVWALGSVLAIHLKVEDAIGYSSIGSERFLKSMGALRDHQGVIWNAHVRALGSVVYIMAGQKTQKETVQALQASIVDALK